MRRTSILFSVLLAAIACVVLLPSAGARGRRTGTARDGRASPGTGTPSPGRMPEYGIQIQAVFTSAGDPVLVANFTPNGALSRPHWHVCWPGTPRCAVVERQEVRPGAEPAGTVFRAVSYFRHRVYAAQVTWRGRVRAVTRPRVLGAARAGAIVHAIPGRWSGGWRNDFDALTIEACLTASGRHCMLLGSSYTGCLPGATTAARVARRYAGWYLFALDAREPADIVCAASLVAHPAPWPLGPTVIRSRPLGPVRAA